VTLRFDARAISTGAIMAGLAGAGSLVDVAISEPSLEDVIRRIYQESGQPFGAELPAEGAPP
jgi:ABC-type uncharacterized transport system ATPase subunit